MRHADWAPHNKRAEINRLGFEDVVAVANGQNAVALLNVAVVNWHVRLHHADHAGVARLKVFAAVNLFVAGLGLFL